jgi:hypothetical protein
VSVNGSAGYPCGFTLPSKRGGFGQKVVEMDIPLLSKETFA